MRLLKFVGRYCAVEADPVSSLGLFHSMPAGENFAMH